MLPLEEAAPTAQFKIITLFCRPIAFNQSLQPKTRIRKRLYRYDPTARGFPSGKQRKYPDVRVQIHDGAIRRMYRIMAPHKYQPEDDQVGRFIQCHRLASAKAEIERIVKRTQLQISQGKFFPLSTLPTASSNLGQTPDVPDHMLHLLH